MKKNKEGLFRNFDYSFVSKIIGGIVILTSLVVMFGWFLDIGVLKSILPGWVSMKFITALCFLFSGVLILLISFSKENEVIKIIVGIISFALVSLMCIFFLSLFFGISTGIESLFVKDVVGAVATSVPGVPAVPTILCFIFIGICGIIFYKNFKNSREFLIFGILILVISGIAILGYLFSNPFLYYRWGERFTAMALHTAILFTFIGISFIFNGIKNKLEKKEK